MSNKKLRAAILIISDTAYADPSTDKAGNVLDETFLADGGDQWVVAERRIIPDDVLAIQRAVKGWCDGEEFMNLVITTGGTGFAVKDQTPEAVTHLIHRYASGLVHGMLAASREVTPFAVMSRPVAGVRNKTLVITLPGSPKGAKENLQALIKLLPHACIQAAGADSRALHAGGVNKLEKEAGVDSIDGSSSDSKHHHHGHGHSHGHGVRGGHVVPKAHTSPDERSKSNDPLAGPTRRYRASPYPMLSVEEATKLILENTPATTSVNTAVNDDLVGSIVAEHVKAMEPVPAYRASIVDGYAFYVEKGGPSTKAVFTVASVSHAKTGEIPALQRGQIARITTGAPLPDGANTVVMVEDTVLKTMTDDGKEEREVKFLSDKIEPGENIREVGSDISAGEVILTKGEEITAVGGELGLLASMGRAEVRVFKKPIVGVLSTGDEIIQHDRQGGLRLGEVRDCNRPTIMAAVRGWGFEAVDLGIAKDEPGALEQTLREAMRRVDVIVTTGGASMGELDLVKPTIERSLGGTIHFGRVSMKPGKPTTFATIPFKNNAGDPESRLIFSLPGNPASAVVTLHLFVLPSLHQASGIQPPGLPKVFVTLDQDIKLDPQRSEYHRVTVTALKDGLLHATSTGGQRSSRVGSLRSANALLCLPVREGFAKKGEKTEALMMGRVLSDFNR